MPAGSVARYGDEVEQRDLRVSDAERQQAVEQLHRAVGEGYITLTEFEERSASAFTATTRGELETVLADIPSSPQSAEPARPSESAQVVELRSTGSDLVRKAAWQVPGKLRVRTRFCTVALDFSEAMITTAVVDIEMDDRASSIKVIVPESATVDCDGLTVSWGELRNNVPTGPPRGRPHLVLHGQVKAGEMKVRQARNNSWLNKLFE